MNPSLVLSLSIASFGVVAQAADQTNAPAATPATNGPAPQIKFEMPVYDFGKVKSGDPVKYTYVFTNTGDALLTVKDVHPSCGCTTAGEWSHTVEPGKTGTIPVQFNSANYNGSVYKTITVTSDAKDQASVTLQLKGSIWKPVDVSPQFAMINIPPDLPPKSSASVHIVNNEEAPLVLSAPEINNKAFTAEIITNQPGKDFQLVITAAPPGGDAPNAQGQVSLKTSSTNMPVINVTAWANVQPLVALNPPTITLPSGPTTAGQTATLTIHNNSTTPLALSEPKLDAKDAKDAKDVKVDDVKVDIKESQPPGHDYTATLTFPAGFELAQGTRLELSIKTGNARTPMIKVPVMQLPKPTTPPIIPVSPTPGTPTSGGNIPTLPPKAPTAAQK